MSRHWARSALALLLVSLPLAAYADEYPSKPIKLLVGASAGGTTDTMARAIAQPLSVSLGKPVLVENRPGAGGNLAADAVAKSQPDGYTLLVSFTSHTINATLYPKLPFDPVADFTAISMISTVPSMLVGHPKVAAQDLKALIALARAQPDKLTIGIGGIGSSLHLAGDQFKMMADVRILNVPYKGTAPALTDVLGGQVDLMFISLVTGSAQVRGGKLRAFGVTSAKRQESFPELPAIGEVVPGFESEASREVCHDDIHLLGKFGSRGKLADESDAIREAVVGGDAFALASKLDLAQQLGLAQSRCGIVGDIHRERCASGLEEHFDG